WSNTQPSNPTPVIPSPTPEPQQPTFEPEVPPTPPIQPVDPPVVEPPLIAQEPTVAMPNVLPEPTVAPQPQPEPPAPATTASAPRSSTKSTPASSRAQRPASSNSTSELMRWLSAFIAAIVALQLLRFLFRPLRRAIALRHLRKPFWEETVDQRVSNWWQLVLVGLRDAGWRTSADEAPREFAKRVGIDGVDKCAAILDRTRHGIRIDGDDLEQMSTSAEAAYRSARSNTSTVARAAAQIRWPLA
ncbi:MAG: hypothetical protein H0V17_08520, partial [Deltaproteobacteria bacterium]|nr:hypothetical protein [Deltaproteobacteria bacterium]